MTPLEYDSLSGIERIRKCGQAFGYCNESFLSCYDPKQLLAIHRAWCLSGWDFMPDQWTPRQVREAIRGIPPCWDRDELPIYGRKPVRT